MSKILKPKDEEVVFNVPVQFKYYLVPISIIITSIAICIVLILVGRAL